MYSHCVRVLCCCLAETCFWEVLVYLLKQTLINLYPEVYLPTNLVRYRLFDQQMLPPAIEHNGLNLKVEMWSWRKSRILGLHIDHVDSSLHQWSITSLKTNCKQMLHFITCKTESIGDYCDSGYIRYIRPSVPRCRSSNRYADSCFSEKQNKEQSKIHYPHSSQTIPYCSTPSVVKSFFESTKAYSVHV